MIITVKISINSLIPSKNLLKFPFSTLSSYLFAWIKIQRNSVCIWWLRLLSLSSLLISKFPLLFHLAIYLLVKLISCRVLMFWTLVTESPWYLMFFHAFWIPMIFNVLPCIIFLAINLKSWSMSGSILGKNISLKMLYTFIRRQRRSTFFCLFSYLQLLMIIA